MNKEFASYVALFRVMKNSFGCCYSLTELSSIGRKGLLANLKAHKKGCMQGIALHMQTMRQAKKQHGKKGIKICSWNKKYAALQASKEEKEQQNKITRKHTPKSPELIARQQAWKKEMKKRGIENYQNPIYRKSNAD